VTGFARITQIDAPASLKVAQIFRLNPRLATTEAAIEGRDVLGLLGNENLTRDSPSITNH
jgi:hypothetical protein